ncbi:MAG TPA: hypothetical protein VF576_10840 [Rubricoccaceae bacterium]
MRITDLVPGETYVVVQPFRDDRGVLVQPGDRQTFEGYAFLPGEGGFAVRFRQETLYLREDDQAEVVEHAERFFRPED